MTKYRVDFEKPGETWCEIYETSDAALAKASVYWHHLSEHDQKSYHITVGPVDERCFNTKWMDDDYLTEGGLPDLSNPETWKQSDGVLRIIWEAKA